MFSNERQNTEREQSQEFNEESDTVRVRANVEAQDAQTIYTRLLEPNAAEASGDFSEQIEQCKKQLNESRTAYVQHYAFVLDARKTKQSAEKIAQLTAEQKKAHDAYVDAKKRYAEVLVDAQKTQLVKKGVPEEERKLELDIYVRTEIFKTLVVDEEIALQNEKAAAQPPEAQGVLRRLYERWDRLSGIQKGLIMTTIATGTAFISTGLGQGFSSLELTSVALLFSKSFLLGATQDFLSGLTALGVNSILTKKIEQNFSASVERERQETRLQSLEQTSERYKALLEKKSLQGSQALVASALTMLAAGRAFSFGINFLSQTHALKDVADAVNTTFESGPDIAGKLSDSDALGKPLKGLAKGVLKKLFTYWKKD